MRANLEKNIVIPMLAIRNAERALEFYQQAFGAIEVNRLTDKNGKISHSEIRIGDVPIMIADEFPGYNHSPQSLGGSTVILYLYVDDVDAFVHRAVENGAKLIRSVELMPHGDRVGKIEDPFGYTWMVATRTED